MKKLLLIVFVSAAALSLHAQKLNPVYLDYIETWKDIAIEQQADYGIPAAITMAQALLESGAGQSELATEAKNHFGIKCSNGWFGGVYYHDDDSKGECFRQYYDAAESYKDHSLFLQRPRYSTCFEIAIEDYEGWAYRLKACGYATDNLYPQKLIKLIEDYRLDTLGVGVPAGVYDPDAAYREPVRSSGATQTEPVEAEPMERDTMPEDSVLVDTVSATAASAPMHKRPLKAVVVRRSEPIMVINNDPEPEYKEPISAREERDNFLLSHPKKRCNGLNYVEAREGDTYANVAFRLNVRERDLREDNDALGRDLMPGDRIYLAPKKLTGANDRPYVWTHPGQSLWKLSQEEGVQVEAIQKLNELDPTIRVFRTRQKIYLRKVKDDGYR
ncbi:MAG: glucosaminidase domain-containing protein [Paludibacteraceae bacterium]|nr:glucosaminidase domain-containing protein [Paludibacteraceae bacterium]